MFHPAPAPSQQELEALAARASKLRMTRWRGTGAGSSVLRPCRRIQTRCRLSPSKSQRLGNRRHHKCKHSSFGRRTPAERGSKYNFPEPGEDQNRRRPCHLPRRDGSNTLLPERTTANPNRRKRFRRRRHRRLLFQPPQTRCRQLRPSRLHPIRRAHPLRLQLPPNCSRWSPLLRFRSPPLRFQPPQTRCRQLRPSRLPPNRSRQPPLLRFRSRPRRWPWGPRRPGRCRHLSRPGHPSHRRGCYRCWQEHPPHG